MVRTTLLGHLAQFGSFSTQGEVLCTQGLTYLLNQDADARAAFAVELGSRAAATVGLDLTWLAEQRQPDGGRPDLEARIDDVPVVKIEAKLDARLGGAQLRSYVAHLRECVADHCYDGVLIVLVPAARTEEATLVIRAEFGVTGSDPWRVRESGHPDIAIAVISWEDVLTVLDRVDSQRFHTEVEQFEGMYRELRSSYIAPLAGREALIDWRNREDDMVKLVKLVTSRLTTEHKIYPMGIDSVEQGLEGLDPRGYNRRYVCRTPEGAKETCFSIGVRDPFAGSETPIWLRFNRTTGSFRDIRDRLESSALAPRLRTSGGHVWIPLDIPLAAHADQMVDALVEQAEAVRRVAYPIDGRDGARAGRT